MNYDITLGTSSSQFHLIIIKTIIHDNLSAGRSSLNQLTDISTYRHVGIFCSVDTFNFIDKNFDISVHLLIDRGKPIKRRTFQLERLSTHKI